MTFDMLNKIVDELNTNFNVDLIVSYDDKVIIVSFRNKQLKLYKDVISDQKMDYYKHSNRLKMLIIKRLNIEKFD